LPTFGAGEAYTQHLRIASITGLKYEACGMDPFRMGQPQKVFALFQTLQHQ